VLISTPNKIHEIPSTSIEVAPEVDIEVGEQWFKYVVPPKEGFSKIGIQCEWEQPHKNDRVGLWIAVADERSSLSETDLSDGHKYDVTNDSEGNPIVDVASWSFGKTSKIHFETISSTQDIIVYILCRPRLHGHDPKELILTIQYYEEVSSTEPNKYEAQRYIMKKKSATPLVKHTVHALEAMGGYRAHGRGNVVHPKQVLTLKSLTWALGELKVKDREDKFSIAYIGSDTLENLTGIFRWLNENEYGSSLGHVTVYTHDRWDDSLLDALNDLVPDNVTKQRDRVRIVPNNGFQRKEALNHDLVITTYVCPWINELEKTNFEELIDKVLGPSSILISVDPIQADFSVRSPIYGKKDFNPQSIFKGDKLDLLDLKEFANNTAEAMLYRRRKNGQEGVL